MSKQQTALEWLYGLIKQSSNEGDLDFVLWNLKANIEQAKQMEKEQIISACEEFMGRSGYDKEDFEQYYNETYGKDL